MKNRYDPYLLLLDLALIAGCFVAAYHLRYSFGFFAMDRIGPPALAAYGWAILLALVLWVLILSGFGSGTFYPLRGLAEILGQVGGGEFVLIVSLLALSYLQQLYYSRLLLLILAALLFVTLLSARLVTLAVFRLLGTRGLATTRVVVVGYGSEASELVQRIQQSKSGYEVVGVLAPERAEGEVLNGEACLFSGDSREASDFLAEHKVDQIIFAMPIGKHPQLLEFVAACQQRGVGVRLLPDFFRLWPFVALTDDFGLPLLEIGESPRQYFLKREFDLLVAGALLVLVSPLLLVLALLLLAVNRGSLISRQARVGQFGRTFTMYRFQNPAAGAHRGSWLFRLGNFLWEFSFLDLPQLWNVLQGNMSMVGPRPEDPDRVRYYTDWHRKRLAVKPGVTGYAQVRGLRERHSSDEKTRYDLEYLTESSLFTDLSLLLLTVRVILRRIGATHGATGEPPAPGSTSSPVSNPGVVQPGGAAGKC